MESSNSQHQALKPVVCELGAAIYLCQLFETNLLYLISILSCNSDNIVTSESFKKGVTEYSEKTLGQLAGAFKKKLSLPDNFEQFIREGVNTRNKLVHGFVMDNNNKFLTVAGRNSLIDELRKSQHFINERLQSVQLILDRALQIFGGSLEQLRKEQEFRFEPEDNNEGTRH